MGTFTPLIGQSVCSLCEKGISPNLNQSGFQEFPKDQGVIFGIQKTSFLVLGSVNTAVSLFSSLNNTNWFHIARAAMSMREILNSAPLQWATRSTIRIKPATEGAPGLNAAVLTRIAAESAGLW